MPVESRDDLVNDLEHAASVADLDGLAQWSPVFRSAAKRIAELEAERDEARLLVTEANNSLFGSQGYFHSLNGGPFDKYHLSRAIEDLKENARRAIAEERERCAAIADVFADQCDATAIASPVIEQVAALRAKEQAATAIATAIRSGKTDGKE